MRGISDRGFTLIEVLLVVVLLSIFSGATYVLYANVSQKGEMDLVVRSVEALMRKAMVLSSAVEGDSEWGVQLDRPNTILFKGSSFATRDTSYDEVVELPDFPLSGKLEYVFKKVSGNPEESGTVEFTNENTGEVRSLSINEKGQISIQ